MPRDFPGFKSSESGTDAHSLSRKLTFTHRVHKRAVYVWAKCPLQGFVAEHWDAPFRCGLNIRFMGRALDTHSTRRAICCLARSTQSIHTGRENRIYSTRMSGEISATLIPSCLLSISMAARHEDSVPNNQKSARRLCRSIGKTPLHQYFCNSNCL